MARQARRSAGAGTVRQLPSGRWQARWRDEDGRLHPAPVTFDTKLDAGAWLDAHPDGPDDDVVVRADPTLREYATTWLRQREIKPRTRQDYQALIDSLILPVLGDVRLSRLTPARVRGWYSDLDPAKPTTRARAYGLLRTILGTAVADDIIDANPCRVRGGGSVKKVHETKVATLAELDVIVAAMPERYRPMVLLAAWCGLRYGELTELRRSDLDLDAGVVRVRRGVTRVGSEYVVGTPKSKAGSRDVAIPSHIVPALTEHLDRHVGADPGSLLFHAAGDPAKHLAPSTLCKVFYPAREAAGRTDLRFHDLRHTGLTLAAATGATLADLMARAGHSTPAAAMIYQHSVADRDKAIAEALSGIAAAKVIPLRRAAK